MYLRIGILFLDSMKITLHFIIARFELDAHADRLCLLQWKFFADRRLVDDSSGEDMVTTC